VTRRRAIEHTNNRNTTGAANTRRSRAIRGDISKTSIGKIKIKQFGVDPVFLASKLALEVWRLWLFPGGCNHQRNHQRSLRQRKCSRVRLTQEGPQPTIFEPAGTDLTGPKTLSYIVPSP